MTASVLLVQLHDKALVVDGELVEREDGALVPLPATRVA